ncbi:hypothetical protein G6F32_017473 [Rhizopus arrhizus]|nr:hypothetical protein G6F32_017473 [Rhizopus arrhizus]
MAKGRREWPGAAEHYQADATPASAHPGANAFASGNSAKRRPIRPISASSRALQAATLPTRPSEVSSRSRSASAATIGLRAAICRR